MPDDHATDDPPPARLPLAAAAELQDDLLVASSDLERLQRLLNDASDSLLGHFHGAARELEGLRQAAAATPAALDAPPLERSMSHVTGAITAMQFQDLAAQLIAHTTLRLRGCADRLARQTLDDDRPPAVASPPQRPNPVSQLEMDAGSIELF